MPFPASSSHQQRAAVLLLLAVTIAIICVWLPNDEQIPWFRRLGNTLFNHRVLSISEGVIKREGSVVQSQRRKA
eukprot:6702940-Ditylum_brightwellii.AAC.1